jgi:murein DD-endopeptidase MepM/ murein hydrolase activator NlpD
VRRWITVLAGTGLTGLALVGCEQIEQLRDEWRPQTPHEAYLKGLHDAGLATTALSQEWIMEAARALRDPRPVSLPYQEEGFIPPEDPTAVGYRFALRRGQRLTVSLAVNSDEATRVFLEVFRIADDPADPPRPLNDVDTTATGLSYEPFRAGEFLVRIQPELLRGGSYELSLAVDPALAFPVQDLDTRAIGSVFGDPRAGGARAHHGVDIFAPRGTPAVAAIAGVVRRANVTNLGGKVVWVRDERYGRSLYYAHLDSQTVGRGQRVEVGDTVGFVGNTGNARTTPPHLHFGIYARGEGPIDPFPYLRRPPGTMPELLADGSVLGTRVRSQGDGVRVRSGPDDDTAVLTDLPRHAPLRVLGGNRSWLRVQLPDGREGYVAARLTEAADVPVARVLAETDRPATRRPRPGSPLVEVLAAGTDFEVLGMYPGYLLVRGPSGHDAWVVDTD